MGSTGFLAVGAHLRRLRTLALGAALGVMACASAGAQQISDQQYVHYVASLWPIAHARGISADTFNAAFKDMTLDPDVLKLIHRQAEFHKSPAQYLSTAVSQERIDNGRAKARDYMSTLVRATRQYGVDSTIIMGIWGLESRFGAYTGNKSVIRSLSTLAAVHYRGNYFRNELLIALKILQHGDVTVDRMTGSWAGAMGQTQFMPSAYMSYAVDFQHNGHRDIWTSVPDALGSTANFLHRHGWHAGERWGYEVRLPRDFNAGTHRRGRMFSFASFAKAGVTRADGRGLPMRGEASLLLPAGRFGPAFLVTHNFKVIKSYNNSTSYALGVALLGDQIGGAPPLVAQWPDMGAATGSITAQRR